MRPSALLATRSMVWAAKPSPSRSAVFRAVAMPTPRVCSRPKSASFSFMSMPSSMKASSSSLHWSTRWRISATVMGASRSWSSSWPPAAYAFFTSTSLFRMVRMMLEWVPRISLMPMPAVVMTSARAYSAVSSCLIITTTWRSSTRPMAFSVTASSMSSSSWRLFSGLDRQAPRAAAYFSPTRGKPGMPTLMPFL